VARISKGTELKRKTDLVLRMTACAKVSDVVIGQGLAGPKLHIWAFGRTC
jgi:hypothetical protein